MSFSRIAVSQAVKKIVIYIRDLEKNADRCAAAGDPWQQTPGDTYGDLADRIERGDWKGVELPKKKKAKKKK